MGSLQAQEMAAFTDLRQGVQWHLTGNHYPPIPVSMVDPCIEAIEAYIEGDMGRKIQLPDGISFRGEREAPVLDIIESHHLWDFINQVVEDESPFDGINRVAP